MTASSFRLCPASRAGRPLVKDYRGKNAERAVWKFDAALVGQINEVLKQAAIEEGQWNGTRGAEGGIDVNVLMARLNAGRKRVAEDRARRDAAARTNTQLPMSTVPI